MFIAGIVAILAQYPPELHTIAVAPTGIPMRIKHLRSLAEIEEVCRGLYEPIARKLVRQRLANQPKALPSPPRSAEEQAKIDEQVAAARKRFGVPS